MGQKVTAGLRFASLFSGCGGFDLGFAQQGFSCVAAFDIDPVAIDIYRMNRGSRAEVCDLTNTEFPIASLQGLDVLLAGPPCQGFSTAGRRQVDDPRNKLLLRAGEIIVQAHPRVALVENVAGVTAGAHRQYWIDLQAMLRAAGYHTAEIRCEGHRMGVAQKRIRMVVLAWDCAKTIRVNIPLISGGVLREALVGVNGTPNHIVRMLSEESGLKKIARHIGPGQKLSNVRGGQKSVHTWHVSEVFGETTDEEKHVLETLLRLRRRNRVRSFGDADPILLNALSSELGWDVDCAVNSLVSKGFVRHIGDKIDLRHTFNGKFRRLSLDQPAPTVDTRFGDPRYFLHPSEDRGFTVREAARIQGFPDDFVFDGPEKAQYRLIGNAVPPPLAACLAMFVRDAILT